MLVYRLEYDNGSPYRSFHLSFNEDMLIVHNDLVLYPNWQWDNLPFNKSIRFACHTDEKLLRWFDGFWKNWKRCSKAKILIVEVPESAVKMGKSGKQCVYYANKVTSVKSLSVKEFLAKYNSSNIYE